MGFLIERRGRESRRTQGRRSGETTTAGPAKQRKPGTHTQLPSVLAILTTRLETTHVMLHNSVACRSQGSPLWDAGDVGTLRSRTRYPAPLRGRRGAPRVPVHAGRHTFTRFHGTKCTTHHGPTRKRAAVGNAEEGVGEGREREARVEKRRGPPRTPWVEHSANTLREGRGRGETTYPRKKSEDTVVVGKKLNRGKSEVSEEKKKKEALSVMRPEGEPWRVPHHVCLASAHARGLSVIFTTPLHA